MGPRHYSGRVASTQALALAHARVHGPAHAVFVADEQEAGIGRLDHAWASPRGGLYVSVVASAPPERAELVPLGVAAAIARELHVRFGAPTAIRWPNDVLATGPGAPRKLAGVLVDAVATSHGPALVVGVGVNVTSLPDAFPLELRGTVARLDEYAPSARVADVEPVVLDAIARTLSRVASAEASRELVAETRSLLLGLGHYVRVDGVRVGIARGLADDGALWVEDGEHLRPVRAGTLAIEEVA